MGWMVSATRHAPAALFSGKGEGTHCTWGWARIGAGVDEYEEPRPTGVRAPDRPPHCESVSQLSLQHRCKFIWGNMKLEYRSVAKKFDRPTQHCLTNISNNITATVRDFRLPPRRRQGLRSSGKELPRYAE